MRTSSPASLISFTDGRRPLPAAVVRRLGSITTRVESPVTSSICFATVDAFLDVLELHRAGVLGDDRPVVRVPGGELLAGAHLVAVGDEERRAVRHLVALALAAVVVDDGDFAGAADHDHVALRVGDVAHAGGEAHRAGRLGLDVACTAVREAAPPMWNVRIVSCVPGSPIDCAAITPIASPTLTGEPRPRSRP